MEGRGRSSGGRGGRGYWRGGSRGSRGRGMHPPDSKYRKGFSDEAEEQVKEMFAKRFNFEDEFEQWRLPEPIQFYRDGVFQLPKFVSLRDKLNEVKSRLNHKDITSWHRHTQFTNRAAFIIPSLRSKYQPEMCTQGWAKLHEIIATFKVIPDSAVQFNSVHLCEAPGGFICSLNHYLKTHRMDTDWHWKAVTLNPYYEGNDLIALIDQDRFLLETIDHWHFGQDNSGDITVRENAQAVISFVKQDFTRVDLVTADGSIDCSNTPAQQEALVSHLLYSETMLALNVLSDGGSFVLKTFTILECQTVCILYLLVACFKEVHVFKPITSKAGNSEHYLVCIGFKGSIVLSDQHLDQLMIGFNKGAFQRRALFPQHSIPDSFLAQLYNCAVQFSGYQINVIEENLDLYDCMRASQKNLISEMKDCISEQYVSRYKLKKMPREKTVINRIFLDGSRLHTVVAAGSDSVPVLGRWSNDSLLKRIEQGKKPWSKVVLEHTGALNTHMRPGRIEAAKSMLSPLIHSSDGDSSEGSEDPVESSPLVALDLEPADVIWLSKSTPRPISKNDLVTLDGRKVEKVINSKFCQNEALKQFNEVITNAQIITSSHAREFTTISSRVYPSHAVEVALPSFFLRQEGMNLAAIEKLTSALSQSGGPLTFVDLWGDPSGYGLYIYWSKQAFVKGWGVKRSENLSKEPLPSTVTQLVDWDSFQSLGPPHGVDITDIATINRLSSRVHDECSQGVQLVIGHVPSLPFGAHRAGYEEILNKRCFLSQCVCALKLLAEKGVFICRITSLLTRFSVGIFYLLYRLFQEVAIVKPVSTSPAVNEQFIVCRGFQGCKPIVCEMLLAVSDHITDLDDEADVLEILPIQLLLDDSFFQCVTKTNDRLLRVQVLALMQLEKFLLQPQNLPGIHVQHELQQALLTLLNIPQNPS